MGNFVWYFLRGSYLEVQWRCFWRHFLLVTEINNMKINMTNPLHEAENLRQIIYRAPPPEPRLSFFPLLVILFVVLLIVPSTTHYSKQELYKEYNGCAYQDCPAFMQKEITLAHNNLLPPSQYEEGTHMKMRATCTYSPNICL